MDLRYKIKEIPPEGRPVVTSLSQPLLADALEAVHCDVAQSEAKLEGSLIPMDGGIYLQGKLGGVLGLFCSRCLQPAQVALDLSLHTIFTRDSAEEQEDPKEDVDYVQFEGDIIDLAPMLREQLILAAPMAPLCSLTCLGLCSICGKDRNREACQHEEEASASRFSVLKSMKLG